MTDENTLEIKRDVETGDPQRVSYGSQNAAASFECREHHTSDGYTLHLRSVDAYSTDGVGELRRAIDAAKSLPWVESVEAL